MKSEAKSDTTAAENRSETAPAAAVAKTDGETAAPAAKAPVGLFLLILLLAL